MLSVSAASFRLLAEIGVAALLSTNASESVVSTATAMLAPELAVVESELVVTPVFRFDVMATSPPEAVIVLVSDSWLFAVAATCASVTDVSLVVMSFQFVGSVSGDIVSIKIPFSAW